jgi:hypothetical protein
MTTFGDQVYQFGGAPVGGIMTDGLTFFVDPSSGSDTNTGRKPDKAFATLQKAIDSCTDNRGDVIVRLPGSETTSATINMNKAGVTIISDVTGSGFIGYGTNPLIAEKFATYPSVALSGPTMIVSQPCALVGLEFVGRNTTSGYTDTGVDSGAAVVFIGEGGGYLGGFSLIKNCRFTDWWGNDYGIEFAAGAYNLIENCTFDGYAAGVYVRSTASNNPTNIIIRDSEFLNCVNGIEHKAGSTPHDVVYGPRNWFYDCSGFPIDTTNVGDGVIIGNYFPDDTDATAYDQDVALIPLKCAGNSYQES